MEWEQVQGDWKKVKKDHPYLLCDRRNDALRFRFYWVVGKSSAPFALQIFPSTQIHECATDVSYY